MLNIAIITGSTRPNRKSLAVANWTYTIAKKRTDAIFEVVDILDFDLPHFDEPVPPLMDQYSKPHTLKWAAKIAQFDAYIFITPEYNHSTSGVLKNAIDFLYKEWTNKACGFVSYGSMGGVRAVEHLRQIMSELMVASVKSQVSLSLFTDFEAYTTFKPLPHHETTVNTMLDQVVSWGGALKTIR